MTRATTKNKLYDVMTWDAEKKRWSPQKGVKCGPRNRWGVRRAVRQLQAMGYGFGLGDYNPFVEVFERPYDPKYLEYSP